METRHAERTGYQSETDSTDQVCFHENIRQTRKQQFHLPEKWKLQLFPQGCHSPGQRAGVSPEIFRAIDPQRIQSVTVLKDQASLAKYTTDKSKTGIIQAKLKKEEQASDINIPTIRFDSQTSKALVIIDGKAADATAVQALSPSQIKSIKVLKGQQAVDLFGEAAKTGQSVFQPDLQNPKLTNKT